MVGYNRSSIMENLTNKKIKTICKYFGLHESENDTLLDENGNEFMIEEKDDIYAICNEDNIFIFNFISDKVNPYLFCHENGSELFNEIIERTLFSSRHYVIYDTEMRRSHIIETGYMNCESFIKYLNQKINVKEYEFLLELLGDKIKNIGFVSYKPKYEKDQYYVFNNNEEILRHKFIASRDRIDRLKRLHIMDGYSLIGSISDELGNLYIAERLKGEHLICEYIYTLCVEKCRSGLI